MCGGECIAASECVAASVAAIVWRRVYGGEPVAAGVWLRVCGCE